MDGGYTDKSLLDGWMEGWMSEGEWWVSGWRMDK